MAKREASEATTSYIVELPNALKPARAPTAPRPVPDVGGLSVREAVTKLHGAGFRVRILRASWAATFPAAGTIAAPGTLVQLSRPLE